MSSLNITRRRFLLNVGLIGASLISPSLPKVPDARAQIRVTREINIKGYNRALLPCGHGQLIELNRPIIRRYPSRDHCMQMMAFFSNSSGLLIQTKDSVGYLSDWQIIPGDKLRIHFYGPEPEIETRLVSPTIEAAAEHYRNWAVQQTWSKKRQAGKEPSIIAVAPDKNCRQQLRSIRRLYEEFPSPIGAWLTQWRRYEFDSMYPDYEANDPAGFATLLSELKSLGCIAYPYINALLWDDRLKSFSWGSSVAVRDKEGKVIQYNKKLSHLKYACPGSKIWRDVISQARNSLLDSEGIISSGVYLDMLVAAGPFLCFATDHDHEPGDPLAWQRGVREILASTGGMVMSEGNAEIYIDKVDALLMHLYTERADTVPLWNFVYGDLTTSVGWQMPNSPTPEQLETELARAKRFGVSCNGSPWMTHKIQEALMTPRFKRSFLNIGGHPRD